MTSGIPLLLQTAYAELLDRAAAGAFDDAFPENGSFTPKTLRGRRYWYFQTAENGRKQLYVGPETPELLERIRRHQEQRTDQRDRHTLVSTLVRAAHLPRPLPAIGEAVSALARAGVFRLRGVLVGTVAYQTYSAMLAVRLPAAIVQTNDIDVAQFADVSAAMADRAPPMLDVLRQADASFRGVPHLRTRHVVSYHAAAGIRVDFLTPNKGPDSEIPRALPALGTDALPLRFLDFLIAEPVSAVLLHGPGIYVTVPTPERYAIHKLIVARRRRSGDAKQDKDLWQARALFEVLCDKRPFELRAAWQEAWGRGRTWQRLMAESMAMLHSPTLRDQVLKIVGATRSIIPGLDLQFDAPAIHYDRGRHVVEFFAKAGVETVRCAVTGEAIDDHFRERELNDTERLRLFRGERSAFEAAARAKYLTQPIEEPSSVLVRTEDFQTSLTSPTAAKARRRPRTPPG